MHGLPVLIVSGIAAVVMVVGALILGGDDDDLDNDNGSLNMRAVFLDTAADAAAAAGVAVAGGIILANGGLFWIDPAVAFVIAIVVGYAQCDCSLPLRQPDAHPLRSPLASHTNHRAGLVSFDHHLG